MVLRRVLTGGCACFRAVVCMPVGHLPSPDAAEHPDPQAARFISLECEALASSDFVSSWVQEHGSGIFRNIPETVHRGWPSGISSPPFACIRTRAFVPIDWAPWNISGEDARGAGDGGFAMGSDCPPNPQVTSVHLFMEGRGSCVLPGGLWGRIICISHENDSTLG